MISRASAGNSTLHICEIQCLICRTLYFCSLNFGIYCAQFFLISVLKIFFKFEIKKQHCWIFTGAGRNEKYKLKRTIKNYIHVSVVQLTGKISKLSNQRVSI